MYTLLILASLLNIASTSIRKYISSDWETDELICMTHLFLSFFIFNLFLWNVNKKNMIRKWNKRNIKNIMLLFGMSFMIFCIVYINSHLIKHYNISKVVPIQTVIYVLSIFGVGVLFFKEPIDIKRIIAMLCFTIGILLT